MTQPLQRPLYHALYWEVGPWTATTTASALAATLGGWPAGATTFAGGALSLLLLVVVLGFGLGWGGGYDVIAEEVPADEVNGSVLAVDGDTYYRVSCVGYGD